MTIQKKATEQYFLLARFITLYKMVLGLLTSKSLGQFQMKAIELYFLFVNVFQFYKVQFEATIVQIWFSSDEEFTEFLSNHTKQPFL